MQLNVNGAKIWARGANLIPPDEMDGRNSREAYFYILKSAADAHYNILRIWGGGVFFPDYVYNLADQFGILIYHDMMYGYPWFGGNTGIPAQNVMQESELRYQLRRLSNHPSIAIWNSCNECDPTSNEMNFVAQTVASEDKSRPIWPASPSLGWISGVNTLTGLPNNSPLIAKNLETYSSSRGSKTSKNCNMKLTIETHGYYQHGEGFKTENSEASLDPFDPNIPPNLDPIFELGSQCPGTFASEFGASAWSSFESVSPTLSPDHWNLHAAPMYERNYAADNEIVAYFPVNWPTDFETASEFNLKKQLYLAMIAQALIIKSDISTRRSRNSFGTLTWQHNEIWPTGGWGGLEYGSVGFTNGQVVGGRWKPLQYFYKDHLFTDLFVSCSVDARCFVKNDNPLKAVSGTLKLTLLNVNNGIKTLLHSRPIDLKVGLTKDASIWFCANYLDLNPNNCMTWDNFLPTYDCTVSSCILLMSIESSIGDELYSSFELLAPPKFMTLPKPNVTFSLKCDPEVGTTEIIVVSDQLALFVGLTTKAQGRFDHNFFILPAGEKKLTFVPFGHLDCNLLLDSTRIEHVSLYF
jgi:beta-galactosidase/beta-glucuronidase